MYRSASSPNIRSLVDSTDSRSAGRLDPGHTLSKHVTVYNLHDPYTNDMSQVCWESVLYASSEKR